MFQIRIPDSIIHYAVLRQFFRRWRYVIGLGGIAVLYFLTALLIDANYVATAIFTMACAVAASVTLVLRYVRHQQTMKEQARDESLNHANPFGGRWPW